MIGDMKGLFVLLFISGLVVPIVCGIFLPTLGNTLYSNLGSEFPLLETFSTWMLKYSDVFQIVAIISIFITMTVSIIRAWFLRSIPIFIIFVFIFYFLEIFFSFMIANMYQIIMDNSIAFQNAGLVVNLNPVFATFILNAPYIMAVYGFLLMVFMYSKFGNPFK